MIAVKEKRVVDIRVDSQAELAPGVGDGVGIRAGGSLFQPAPSQP